MKRSMKLMMFAALLVLTFKVSAQSTTKFSIGIKGGPNFSNLNTAASANANYNNRNGFHAGAFALLKFSKIGIQPEVLFSQQGSSVKIASSTSDLKSDFSYMNIPIIVKLYSIAGINLQIGPQFGFLTSAKSNYDPTTGQQFTSTQDVRNAYNNSDVSLALGVGWDLPLGLSIDGRYNWGLSDIHSGAGAVVKNQVWQFSLGYKLIKF